MGQEGRGSYTPAGNRAQTGQRERGWGKGTGRTGKQRLQTALCTVRGAEGPSGPARLGIVELGGLHRRRRARQPAGRSLGERVKPRFPHL